MTPPRNRKSLETKSGWAHGIALYRHQEMLESILSRVLVGTGSDGTFQHQGEDFVYMLEDMLGVWLDESNATFSSGVIVSGSRAIVATAFQPHRQTGSRSLR